ncbi:hypothetical protein A9P82_15075 [Arachidicoccus ginsenosidimutans]|uniref:DUF4293 domain-containing protein n=1 Tax=Arachidicoccus sp. BS20 TaxID=1850526 RepID=UPI0007F0F0FA|nr:DUF4293 domain-containing protein [Arachidicoccus sp. BS20]ANI90494.1 hypothetical protein A9P82_15075 [Arachidicoccus sp. BS20]
MIQRIQSLWLFVAAILAVLSFKFPFYVGTWLNGTTQHAQISLNGHNPSIPVLITTVVTIVLSLVTIFLYKNRKQQLWLVVLNLVVSLVLIYLYYYEIHTFFVTNSGGTIAITAVFVIAIPIVLILAIRGINRDIKLLKNADRLRS